MGTPHRHWFHRAIRGLGLAVGIGIALGAVAAAPRQDALRCLLAMTSGSVPEDAAVLPGFTLRTDAEPELGYRKLWVARPEEEGPHPVLLFMHGITAKGIDDGRVIQAVAAFRDAGFVVVAPEIQLLTTPPDGDNDVERMQRLLHAVSAGEVSQTQPDRIGVVAISVGGGIALRACAGFRAEGGEGLRAMLVLGAPDNVRRVATTQWFPDDITDPAAERDFVWQRRHASELCRSVLFRGALPARVHNLWDRVRLKAWLEEAWMPSFVPSDLLTAEGREFARLVISSPEERGAAAASIMDDAWPYVRPFSPSDPDVDLAPLAGVACFLMNGVYDPLVPLSEIKHLQARLSRHTLCVALESRLIGHAELEDVGLSEQFDHVVYMDDFFDMIGG